MYLQLYNIRFIDYLVDMALNGPGRLGKGILRLMNEREMAKEP